MLVVEKKEETRELEKDLGAWILFAFGNVTFNFDIHLQLLHPQWPRLPRLTRIRNSSE